MHTDHDIMACAGCLCLASRRAARAISRAFERRLRPHGIRIGQFSLLTALLLQGPMSVGALADFLGLERTTLTRNLALVEAKGWAETHPGEDARARIVAITVAGQEKVRAVFPVWQEAQAAATDALGETGVRSLQRLAHKPVG